MLVRASVFIKTHLKVGDFTPLSVRRFTSIIYSTDFGQHTEFTLQSVLNQEYMLRLFMGNEDKELQTRDNSTWTQSNACMSLVTQLRTLPEGCVCAEMFSDIQHPRGGPNEERSFILGEVPSRYRLRVSSATIMPRYTALDSTHRFSFLTVRTPMCGRR